MSESEGMTMSRDNLKSILAMCQSALETNKEVVGQGEIDEAQKFLTIIDAANKHSDGFKSPAFATSLFDIDFAKVGKLLQWFVDTETKLLNSETDEKAISFLKNLQGRNIILALLAELIPAK